MDLVSLMDYMDYRLTEEGKGKSRWLSSNPLVVVTSKAIAAFTEDADIDCCHSTFIL